MSDTSESWVLKGLEIHRQGTSEVVATACCLKDARLIAAAPEMLEALRLAVTNYRIMSEFLESHVPVETDNILRASNQFAEIIAKATGERPDIVDDRLRHHRLSDIQ